jgi:hydrophobe/amphiphile efflux-3 (HAE3) family protein
MERIFREFGSFIEKRRGLVIVAGLVLIVALLLGAMRLATSTGADTWVSSSSKIYKDYQRFNTHFGSEVIVVMVTGDNLTQLLQPENVRAMATVESQMAAGPKVLSVTGPVFFMTQMVAQQTGTTVLPNDPQALQAMVMDNQTGQIRPELAGVFLDAKHVLIPITLNGGLSPDEQAGLVKETQSVVDTAGFVSVATMVTGGVAITSQVGDMIASAMRTMLIVAIVLMFVILALIFRVRGYFAWRWLALGMVALGIIYTFGVMGLIGVPITMVTMAVFPVLIGLGIDYSINLHNRYDEEIGKGESPSYAVINSVAHIGPTLAIALFSECIGFSAIFFSSVPMIRDFGLMLILGVIICYLVAIFFTLPILYWRDTRAGKRTPSIQAGTRPPKESTDFLDRGLGRLATWVINKPALVIPVGLALAVVGFVYNFHVQTETDWTNLLSRDIPVVENFQTFMEIAGAHGPTSLSVLVETDDVTKPETLDWMLQFEGFVRSLQTVEDPHASSISDLVLQANGGEMPGTSEEIKQSLAELPAPLVSNLVSADYKAANIMVGFGSGDTGTYDDWRALPAQLEKYVVDHPLGSYVAVTGASVINAELLGALSSGRTQITLIGIGIVFFGLLLVFRLNLTKTILSWLPLVLVIGWVAGVMYLAGIKYNPLTICLGAMIMGMGVEYTILYMMRYYEERGKGEMPAPAMHTAITKVGRAITASGVTTIGGFVSLLAAGGFVLIREFSFVTMLAVFFGLVSALVVHPPMVVVVDSWLEKRRLRAAQKGLDNVRTGNDH